jgi:hypothetical protein
LKSWLKYCSTFCYSQYFRYFTNVYTIGLEFFLFRYFVYHAVINVYCVRYHSMLFLEFSVQKVENATVLHWTWLQQSLKHRSCSLHSDCIISIPTNKLTYIGYPNFIQTGPFERVYRKLKHPKRFLEISVLP